MLYVSEGTAILGGDDEEVAAPAGTVPISAATRC